MKQLILIIAIFSFGNLLSQGIKTVTKIEKDSIYIKWLPSNFDQLLLISKGAKVSRIESSATLNLESVAFEGAKTWELKPLLSRFKTIDTLEKINQNFATLLEPIYLNNLLPEQKNFALGTIVIENVINPSFQDILGNSIVDTGFKPSTDYLYKIEITGSKPLFVNVKSSELTKYPKIENYKISLDQRKVVDVKWDSKSVQKIAFGFELEHSLDTLKQSKKLTEKPYLPFKSSSEKQDKQELYRDETPDKGKMNYYRLIGLDPFGQPEIITDWKGIYVPLLIEAHPQIDTIKAKSEERIIEVSVYTEVKSPNIEKIGLFRSLQRDTLFELIESRNYSKSTETFTTRGLKSGDHFYYKLALINKDDTVFSTPYYFFTLDQEPPSAPKGLVGKIDSLGIVTLNWDKGIEDDLKGYRVFRANALDEDFVESTKRLILNQTFHDTLPLDNLTSEIYYFIQVVDNNYNNSIQSDTILVMKPDTIAPSQALIKTIKQELNKVIITWENSFSTDLSNSFLIRSSKNSIDTILNWQNVTLNQYEDSSLLSGLYYSYRILSTDKVGNKSSSRTYELYFEPGIRKQMEGFKAVVDKTNKSIVLSWDKPKDEVYSYQLLRKKTDGNYLPLKTITDANQLQYEDKNVTLNTSYSYAIKYLNSDGIQSLPVYTIIIYQ